MFSHVNSDLKKKSSSHDSIFQTYFKYTINIK